MFVNIIKSYRITIAICDSELIGKYFEEGDFQLDVKEKFFKGEEMSEDEVGELMSKMSAEDATFNIVGEKSVGLALKSGLVSEEAVKKIQGIPFILVLG